MLFAISLYVLTSVGVFLIAKSEAILTVFGRDPTLTGRTGLWAASWDLIRANPVLGYGFNSFTSTEAGGLSERVSFIVGWAVPSAHSGLLGIWLDLGLVGLMALLGAYVLAIARTTSRSRSCLSAGTVWPIAFLIAFGLTNITESAVYAKYLIWSIFVAVATLPSDAPARRSPNRRLRSRGAS